MEHDLKTVATEFAKARDQVSAMGEDLKGKMAAGEKNLDDLKGRVDEALMSMNEIKASMTELQQKAARPSGPGEAHKSAGQRLIESESLINYKNNGASVGTSARINIKADGAIITSGRGIAGGAGELVQPMILPGVVAPPMQRLVVRDLLAQGRTDSSAISYVRETGFANNAATVAENTRKPQSSLEYDLKTTNVQVIAHYMKASRQILDDAPMLASTIDGRLMQGLKLVEERQLLNGDGSGSNLLGILPQATVYANPTNLANTTAIDTLRLAILQVALAEYPATGIVLSLQDWAKIELLKDTTGRYIIGDPQSPISARLWGLPVVSTPSMAPDNFLVGAFNLGAQIFDRMDASIAVATQNEDDFIHNRVTILCEERLALAVYRPEAFVKGALTV